MRWLDLCKIIFSGVGEKVVGILKRKSIKYKYNKGLIDLLYLRFKKVYLV